MHGLRILLLLLYCGVNIVILPTTPQALPSAPAAALKHVVKTAKLAPVTTITGSSSSDASPGKVYYSHVFSHWDSKSWLMFRASRVNFQCFCLCHCLSSMLLRASRVNVIPGDLLGGFVFFIMYTALDYLLSWWHFIR